jgi:large subunit ribosomal protein L21
LVYAIVRSGGKQYRAEPGAKLQVDRLTSNVGDKITFSDVLLVSTDAGVTAGNPVSGASVSATVIAQIRDTKVRVFKFKHRKHYKKTRGHRQYLTTVRVDGVQA